MNITKTQISAILVAMAALSGTAYAQSSSNNFETSFGQTQSDLNALTFGNLPAGIQTVVNNLSNYRITELNKNIGFIVAKGNADLAVITKEGAIDAKTAEIAALIIANQFDPQIAVEQGNLVTLTSDLATLNANAATAAAAVTDSDAKIALYTQAIDGSVAGAQTAVANAAADINKARDQFAAGANTANPNYAATGAAGLQSVIDEISGAPAGDQTSATTAITTADSTFISSGGAGTGTLADVQNLVSTIDTQLPTLPPISQTDKDAALNSVLNGSYERAAIVTNTSAITNEVSTRSALIRTGADGLVHIGTNSLIIDDTAAAGAGNINLTANDSSGAPAKITVATNFAVTGNSTLTGALTANGGVSTTTLVTSGNATLSSAAVTNNLSVGGTSTLTGALAANGGVSTTTLVTSGNATLNSAAVATNLSVGGATTLTGALTANGGISTTTLSTSGLLSANNGLSVTGNSTLTGGLTVGGATTLTGALTANGGVSTTTLVTSGNATLNSAAVTNNLSVGGTSTTNGLSVTGAAAFSSRPTVTGGVLATALTPANAVALNADIVNEAAIRTSNDNAIIAGAGLNPNGNYSAPVGTTFLGQTTTLRGATIALDDALTATNVRTTALEGRMGNAERNIKTLRKGVAMAAALQTPVINEGDDNAIKVGAAGFDGESGLAIGYARRINESVTVNAELATGFPDVIARGGVNYSF